jgi:ABC-type sugar transport system ATPase subunit
VRPIEPRLLARDGSASPLPPALEWRNVSVDLGEFLVDDVSLSADPGSWTCIVGPTGAGKTLLLEVATGFLAPTRGCVLRGGVDITKQPPERRRLAYVPQDDLLFPHLDVRANLGFGIPDRNKEIEVRLESIARDLDILHLLRRRINAISGGEIQRVAIGRALLLDLDVLLLDECTSALDEETREIVGRFLETERSRSNLCVVQVTHDSSEARRLADVIVTMRRGRVVEVERPSKRLEGIDRILPRIGAEIGGRS